MSAHYKERILSTEELMMLDLIASGFTTAEVAVLSVIAAEFRDRGSCSLTIGEIARRSSACRTTCKNAIHWAARWGLIEVTERRIARDRNAPNRIVITNGTWLAWLRLRPGPVRPWGEGSFPQPEAKAPYNKEGLAMEANGLPSSENAIGGDCRSGGKPG